MIGLLCLCFAVSLTMGVPYNRYRPQRTVMFGGYLGHPMSAGTDYSPEGAMTAFASGDTIATNSFVGDEPLDFEPKPELTTLRPYNTVLTEEADKDEQIPVLDESSSESKVSKRIPKKKAQKPQKPSKDDDEEDDDDNGGSWPFGIGRNGAPNYNAFFPIMIGGLPGSRTRSNGDQGGYYPGSATAIANSFSTGRGGVASSHAVSFGDPSLAELFRNRRVNVKKPAEE